MFGWEVIQNNLSKMYKMKSVFGKIVRSGP